MTKTWELRNTLTLIKLAATSQTVWLISYHALIHSFIHSFTWVSNLNWMPRPVLVQTLNSTDKQKLTQNIQTLCIEIHHSFIQSKYLLWLTVLAASVLNQNQAGLISLTGSIIVASLPLCLRLSMRQHTPCLFVGKQQVTANTGCSLSTFNYSESIRGATACKEMN